MKYFLARFSLLLPALVSLIPVGCVVSPTRAVVMDFEVLANDNSLNHLSGALPECLTTVINNSRRPVRVMERQDVNYYLREIDKAPYPMRLTRWQQLGERLDIDYFITGSVSRLDDQILIQTRLFSVDKGEVLTGSAHALRCTTADQIPKAATELGGKLINSMAPER